MEVTDYYYKILDLSYDATEKDINDAYNDKIKRFINLPFLNEVQKSEVKDLKKAKFVLTNEELKKIYDAIIISNMKEDKKTDESRKEKLDSQVMGNRIFSMAGLLNTPQLNYGIDRNFSKS